MVDVGCKTESAYPDYETISSRWSMEISPWIDEVYQDLKTGKRDLADQELTQDKLDQLIARKDSCQKIYDMYGVTALLTALPWPADAC